MDERGQSEARGGPTIAEAVEQVGGRIANAIVIAGMIVGVVVWLQPGPGRYQVVADGDRIVRVDMRSGTVIACEDGRCSRVLRKGQRLEPDEEEDGEKAREPARALAPSEPQPQPPASAPAEPPPEQKAEPAR